MFRHYKTLMQRMDVILKAAYEPTCEFRNKPPKAVDKAVAWLLIRTDVCKPDVV
jgi:hypothetical protein